MSCLEDVGRCGRSERTWLLNFGVSQPLVGAFKPAQRQQFYGCLSVFRAAEWKQETHTWNTSETPTNITFQVLCRKTHLSPNSKLQSQRNAEEEVGSVNMTLYVWPLGSSHPQLETPTGSHRIPRAELLWGPYAGRGLCPSFLGHVRSGEVQPRLRSTIRLSTMTIPIFGWISPIELWTQVNTSSSKFDALSMSIHVACCFTVKIRPEIDI